MLPSSAVTTAHNRLLSPCALFLCRSILFKKAEDEFDFVVLDHEHPIDAPFKTLDFVYDPLGIQTVGSCNGLLLCSSFKYYSPEAKHYVFNPTTNQFTVLPPPTKIASGICGNFFIAFDPMKSPHYKVICASQCMLSEPGFRIEIYSSETQKWKVSDAGFTVDESSIAIRGGVFWNGAIHWYTDKGPCFYFDVDEEQVKEMPMPAIPDKSQWRRVEYFGECKGHLYLVEIYNFPFTNFEVREMEGDYSGWIVKYRIDLDEMITSYLDPFFTEDHVFKIMYIVKGESDDDDGSYLVLRIPTKIIRYNLKDNTFEKLCDFTAPFDRGDGLYYLEPYDAYEYIQSNACV